MKITSNKIKSNDFHPDNKKLIETLGGVLNPLIDKIVTGFNKNLTVEDNLPFEFRTLDTRVDEQGIPQINQIINTALVGFKGYICLNVILKDASRSDLTLSLSTQDNNTIITQDGEIIGDSPYKMFPTACPFITVETSGFSVYIRHIAGLQPNVDYRLILLGIS